MRSDFSLNNSTWDFKGQQYNIYGVIYTIVEKPAVILVHLH